MKDENQKTVEYALEALLPYPPKILKQINQNDASGGRLNN
jgi:hypothetical protein